MVKIKGFAERLKKCLKGRKFRKFWGQVYDSFKNYNAGLQINRRDSQKHDPFVLRLSKTGLIFMKNCGFYDEVKYLPTQA